MYSSLFFFCWLIQLATAYDSPSCQRRAESLGAKGADFPRCDPSRWHSHCYFELPQPAEPMPTNLTIAFYGDQGVGPRQVRLMQNLVQIDGVQAIVHAGDFDYNNNATLFFEQINAGVGPDFPYFFAIGNHDVPSYAQYANYIRERYVRLKAKCLGDIGRDQVCSFKGFTFVLSGVGTSTTFGSEFIRPAFERFGGIWRSCVWHKNQRLMQLGGKQDEVGWDAYAACLNVGAFIHTGHEHSYGRTVEMTGFGTDIGNPPFRFISGASGADRDSPIPLRDGENGIASNFVSVAGTAGMPIRYCQQNSQNNPWWAKALCMPFFSDAGALVCKFNFNGERRLAYCYFRTDRGEILDSFWVRSYVESTKSFPCDGSTPPDPDDALQFTWPETDLTACQMHGCWKDPSSYANQINSDTFCTCCALNCEPPPGQNCENACATQMCSSNKQCLLRAQQGTAAVSSPSAAGDKTTSLHSTPERTVVATPKSMEKMMPTASGSAGDTTAQQNSSVPSEGASSSAAIIVIVVILLLISFGIGLMYYKRRQSRQTSQFWRFNEFNDDDDDSSGL